VAERRLGSDDALPGLGQGVPDAIPERRRPLASRMRPRDLSEVVGHAGLLGPEALLPRLIKADNFGSLLFYGPPGCGKTTLAEVIAAETQSFVVRVNAVLSGTPELREILADARRQPSRKTVLVVDEIHRFNKAQQDLLLPDVEAGVVRLIGCTTHNPGLYVVPALLSHVPRHRPCGQGARSGRPRHQGFGEGAPAGRRDGFGRSAPRP
jgi:putative ATPase